jgi:hypothetical protein
MLNETKNNKPKGYVIYPDQWKALKGLPLAKLGRVFQAVYENLNGMEGAENELKGSVRLAYDFLKVQFDVDVEKYDQLCELNRRKAKRRWEKKKHADDAAAFSAMHKKENEKEKENTNPTSSLSVDKENSLAAIKEISDKSANSDAAAARLSKVDDEGWQRNFVYVFNNLVKDSNIPPINRLSNLRLEKLRVLLKDFTTKDIATVCGKAAASDFLNYRGTKHKFQATFDWLMEPENFLKVLEGTYR